MSIKEIAKSLWRDIDKAVLKPNINDRYDKFRLTKVDEIITNDGNGKYVVGNDGYTTIIDNFIGGIICQYDIEFRNCLFECEVLLKNDNVSDTNCDTTPFRPYYKRLDFVNCIFANTFDANRIKFNGQISFESVTFLAKANFREAIFKDERKTRTDIARGIKFKKMTFEGKVDFSNASFYAWVGDFGFNFRENSEVDFSCATFCREADFSDITFYNKIDFEGAIFKDKVIFLNTIFKNQANFGAKFLGGELHNIDSYKVTEFQRGIEFCRVRFEKSANFRLSKFSQNGGECRFSVDFCDEAYFNDCHFFEKVNFEGKTFPKEITFERSYFQGELSFSKTHFKKQVRFNECHFLYETKFDNVTFSSDTYFNNSYFKNYADFHESNFFENASFYNSTFDETPNFSTCTFKNIKGTNFINISVDNIDLESIERFTNRYEKDDSYINEIQDNNDKEQITLQHKIRYAKNARDSFRTIKDVLITNNNLLDAQNWHTLELYAKELELEHKIKQTESQSKKSENWTNFILWIDKTILALYRMTSNHHTNFTTILNFTAGMICIYGIFLWRVDFMLPSIVMEENIKICCGIVLITIFCAILILIFPYFRNKTAILLIVIFSAIFIVAPFIAHIIELATTSLIVSLFLIVYVVCLVGFYALFYRISTFSVIVLTYVLLLVILISKPQLINPFIGVFKTDSIIDTKLESQMLTMSEKDMQTLANIALKRFNSNNEKIENPREIIKQNEDILSSFYRKVNNYKQDEYKKILDLLESNELSQDDKATQLKTLKLKALNILNDILAQDFIDCIVIQASDESTMKSIKHIIKREAESIYVLNTITNDDIQKMLKLISIDKIQKDIFKSTSILYAIILVLCIFSIQKTARKNSIMPS